MFRLEKKYQILFIGATIFLVALFFLTRNVPFFWDARWDSNISTWFLENGFQQWVAPTDINAGHLPLWNYLLNISWEIGGQTLIASRTMLLVVVIGVFYQLIRLLSYHVSVKVPIWACLLVLVEPTLLAQTTNLTNEMLLVFFVLLGLNSIYTNQRIFLIVALTGILYSNLRGIGFFSALFVIDFLFSYFKLKKDSQKFHWYLYTIPILFFSLFLTYQYQTIGWVIKHPESSHRKFADGSMMLKTTFAIGKALLEYGRLFVFIPLVFMLFMLIRKKTLLKLPVNTLRILVMLVVILGSLSGLFILMTNPAGPRYFLVVYALATLLFLNLCFDFLSKKKIRIGLWSLAMVGFLTGHLWIYPPTLSQGWDSTFAYLHFFSIRDKMIESIADKGLKQEDIGTNITLNDRGKSDLEPINLQFAELDLSKNKYVLLSNIENKTSNEDIHTLMNEWELVESYCQMGVFMNLYKNPSFQD